MYNVFHQFFDYMRYYAAVNKADRAHEKTGERYYVMPSTGYNRKLIIVDRPNFRKLKQKGYISHRANQRDLVSECFYCTPYINGNGYLDEQGRKKKLAQYFSWCKAQRKLKSQKKHERKSIKSKQ